MAPAAILCGREPKMGHFMIQNLSPTVEVVHVCTTNETALSEIPSLLRGTSKSPSSNLGTNANATTIRTDISLIIIGGGFSKDDVHAIKGVADPVREVPIFWADVSKTAGQGRPTPEVVRDRILECLENERDGEGWKAGVHMY